MEVYILRIATDPTLNLVALHKYDLNQQNALPVTPAQFSRRLINIEWFTVSNAADRPKSNIIVTWWLSITLSISFCTFTDAVSVLWPARYADSNGSSALLTERWSRSWVETVRSINLEMNFRLETGRKVLKIKLRPAFFRKGVTKADLKIFDTWHNSSEAFMMVVIIGLNSEWHLDKSHVGKGSRSQVFLGDFLISFDTSSPDSCLKKLSVNWKRLVSTGGRRFLFNFISIKSSWIANTFLIKKFPNVDASCITDEWSGRGNFFLLLNKVSITLKSDLGLLEFSRTKLE